MATVRARLDVLEHSLEFRRRGAIAALSEWITREAHDDEREAWDRDLLNMPMPDALLASTGWSREAADEYIASEVGPVRVGDDAIIRGMLARVPADIMRRVSEAFGDGVETFEP